MAVVAGFAVVATGLVTSPSPASADPSADDSTSSLRTGVLSLANAIAAVGQTPELAEPLPFTRTSPAYLLDLDNVLATKLSEALSKDYANEADRTEAALQAVPGVVDPIVSDGGKKITFGYERTVHQSLDLAQDDGDFRFVGKQTAGTVDISLATAPSTTADPDATKFVVQVDPTQDDPLLRFALVSQPVLDYSVQVHNDAVGAFDARQGFTDISVVGGHYQLSRTATITMRDPDGRSLLTLEDLRYSTLPDLFRIDRDPASRLSVGFDLQLPASLDVAGGTAVSRLGTLTMTQGAPPADVVWPKLTDDDEQYGDALAAATNMSMADGLTSLSKYTGATLALQQAANVTFPNLNGGTGDLFAPGDSLLNLLSSTAVAQIRCGLAPGNPPSGVAAPGDTVYCDAVPASGIGNVASVAWSTRSGTIAANGADQHTVGATPTRTVQIDGSNGDPDVSVALTLADGNVLTARTMPRTIEDVVSRIRQLDSSDDSTRAAKATVNLTAQRLDVAVDLRQPSRTKSFGLGNPATLGALVGLTGLESGSDDSKAPVTASDASYDLGFGISTLDPPADATRTMVLLPKDESLVRVGGVTGGEPQNAIGIPARIGFLGVTADVTDIALGTDDSRPAAALQLTGSVPDSLPVDALIGTDGGLKPATVAVSSGLTGAVTVMATENPLDGRYVSGVAGGASGSATVEWPVDGIPKVRFGSGYDDLRVFDPIPASFLHGTSSVTPGTADAGTTAGESTPDVVTITVDDPTTSLSTLLNLPEGSTGNVEVARRLLAPGVACQNFTVTGAHTLTCDGLAPQGKAADTMRSGASVDVIVAGDPFALRDGVIEGLSATLNSFDTLAGDNIADELPDDQYLSTLPLVDLTPAQVAGERGDLGKLIADLSKAADADAAGASTGASVSSAQEMVTTVAASTRTRGPRIALDVQAGKVVARLAGSTKPSEATLKTNLRFDVGGTGQVIGQGTVPVSVDSTTTLATEVDQDTARSFTGDATRTESTVTLDRTNPQLSGTSYQAGVGSFTADGTDDHANLTLGVVTAYDPATGLLKTTRDNRGSDATKDAATAQLTMPDGTEIPYTAKATDSSGGKGNVQGPAAMEVKFLAEGLDGYASALGAALDGSSARNVRANNGLPVAVPLLGSNLDAGAGVAGRLTALTSRLRDQLASVTTAASADLPAAVEKAAEDAMGNGLSGNDITAHVTCTDPDATECDPTGWQEVTLSMEVTAASVSGTAPFDIGLPGLAIKSDRKVDTQAGWSLPVTLKLTRGVGPQVHVGDGSPLALDASASMQLSDAASKCAGATGSGPCMKAVMGYLPAGLRPAGGNAENSSVDFGVKVTPTVAAGGDDYSLFDLYDGKLAATAAFDRSDQHAAEQGLSLDFATTARGTGAFGLVGQVNVPWSSAGFSNDKPITYDDVKLNTPDVVKQLKTPFQTVDPYLGPARDVMDVLRAKLPVVSDLSELAGGGQISMMTLLDKYGSKNKKLDLAVRVIHFVDAVTTIVKMGAEAGDTVPLTDLSKAGKLLSVRPLDVTLHESCTETLRETVASGGTTTKQTTTKSCKKEDQDKAKAQAEADAKKQGAKNATTKEKRAGTRSISDSVAKTTSKFTAPMPGFSLPFMEDPNQLVDVLTGEGEASYFRIDFGHLVAQMEYTQQFGPIMAGPIPISPFIGGSIKVDGRLAVGFDSLSQTQAAQSLSSPGAVDELEKKYAAFDGGNLIRDGFYLDDLENGVDVPEVKLVTTLEAGASVSIGIVSAGLKGSVTLTIALDLHDPNHDGKVRMAELTKMGGKCAFDAEATIGAVIKVFVEINLLITKKSWDYDIVRFGPYTIFQYKCSDSVPSLVRWHDGALQLTSGSDDKARNLSNGDVVDQYDVRQFDTAGGAAGPDPAGSTSYEIAAFGQVQRVDVTKNRGGGYQVGIWKVSKLASTEKQSEDTTATLPQFVADGGEQNDTLRFLTGESFDAGDNLVTTPFAARVAVDGGEGDDTIVSGSGNDRIRGGSGADSIDSGLGNDVVDGDDMQADDSGSAGNDVIAAGAGRDDVNGNGGADRLSGGPSGDRIVGGDGDDSLAGGPGRDVRAVLVAKSESEMTTLVQQQAAVGFDSGDVLVGSSGSDIVDGNDGSDIVVGGDAPTLTGAGLATLFAPRDRQVNVMVEGDEGPTTRTVSTDAAVVPGPAQLDSLCASGTAQTGTAVADFVTGGGEADVVVGSDGVDELDGGAGPDEVCGRNGDDYLSGDGAAPASPRAGEDNDVLRGGLGDDRIDAGAGNDAAYGDDVTLVRDGKRVVDGTLGGAASSAGHGDDYLDGGTGEDVLAGGLGSDLVRGEAGDDVTSGDGRDTAATGGTAPSLRDRLVACNPVTRVVNGYVDLDGDLLAGDSPVAGVTPDDGRFAGLEVVDGSIQDLGGTGALTGLVGGSTVVIGGRVDLDRDGDTDSDDNGTVPLSSMLGTSDANPDGDCVLADEGDDEVRGGAGSDYLGAGDGTDLADGGDGNDLVLGDAGTDVLLGGPHHDVLVGGDGADHLVGGAGDDRLRGNEGDDSLLGGGETAAATDGEDVELGGPGTDVLVAENGKVVSRAVTTQLGTAPWRSAAGVPATVLADPTGVPFADSAVRCAGEATPSRWVTLLTGGNETRTPHASPGGPLLYDELYGGYGCDWVFGSRADDLVRGGQDDDVVEAGSGADTVYGDAGNDVVVGGSTVDPATGGGVTVKRSGAGAPDGGDTIYGDAGPDGEIGRDLVAADNATPLWVSGSTYAIQLYDVQRSGGSAVASTAYGNDTVYGDAAGVISGTGGEDRIVGQGGDDMLSGGVSDDYLEGDSGADVVNGGDGQDDVLGGSSASDGLPLGSSATRLTQPVKALDTSASGLLDESDVVHGGAGHDVVLGDNGRITRPAAGTIDATHTYRSVAMADTEAGDTSGSDDLSGDQGDDVLYGQMDDTARSLGTSILGTGDRLHGGTEADAVLGDLGVVAPTPATGARRLVSNGSFIQEDIYQAGTLVPVTSVPPAMVGIGGSDMAWGDGGNDTIRLGADRDLATGGDGDDVVLGGDADDTLWGGLGHDRLFGGYGDDRLDLKRPAGDTSTLWTATYTQVAGAEDLDDKLSTTNGADLVYGGWGADRLQADQGGAGVQPGSDQLVDWVGDHNLYLVCNGAYGAGYVLRQSSPDVAGLLSNLVNAAGGTDVATSGSAAYYDLGLVTSSGNSSNSKPIVGAPGNNTCEGAG